MTMDPYIMKSPSPYQNFNMGHIWTKVGNYLGQNMGLLRELYGNYMAGLEPYFKIS